MNRPLARTLSILGPAALLWSGLPVAAQSVRQITDVRVDGLGGYAIDDRGAAVWAVTSADPFGANPAHEYQVVKWGGAGVGSQATTIGGLGRSVSVSDGGDWIAFASRSDPLGQNADRSLELFVQSADGITIRQLTDDAGPRAGRVQTAMISGSGNRVAFVSNSDLLGTNPGRVDQLYVVDTDGTDLGQPFVATAAESFGGLAISDDGQRIVFAYTGDLTGANPQGASQVYRVAADGSGLYQFSSFTDPSDQPTISGFGNVVVYRVKGSAFRLQKVNWDTSGALDLGSGTDPSLTDDGSTVFYVAADSNIEIFNRPTAGGPATQLTFTTWPARHFDPVVSGGGGRVAFTAQYVEGGGYALRVMDSDGTDIEPLVDMAPSSGSWLPDITPDGSRVVFLNEHTGDLFRVESDGTDLVQLTSGAGASNPSVSGDGQTIVFLSSQDLTGEGCPNQGRAYKIAADGSGLVRLSPCQSFADAPVISRDGSKVVYQLLDSLYAVPPSGGVPGLVIDDNNSLRKSPRLSHDGEWVVYQAGSSAPPGSVVFRARTDGSSVEEVAFFPGPTWPRPDISGDGSRIVYAYSGEIFLYEAATGQSRYLTQTADGSNLDPRISGDGQFVYFRSSSASLQPMPGPGEDLFRMRIDTGEIQRATGVPEPRGSVPSWSPSLSAHYAVDQVGGAVFGFAFNSTLENPDLNLELFRVDFEAAPGLSVGAGDPTALRWDADPGATTYDAIRGDLASVGPGLGGTVDLGPVVCLADDAGAPCAEDTEQPAPGQGFFYLVRAGSGEWGSGTGGAARIAGPGDCALP